MRTCLIALVLAAGSAARADDSPCEATDIADDDASPAACDGADIEIARACHCTAEGEDRPWGATADLALEVPAALRVASGSSTEIPFILRYRGKTPVELDFRGGDVVFPTALRRGDRDVDSAACAVLGVLPPLVRLRLRPGATVRGTLSWRAKDHQHHACDEMAKNLAPGRYRLTLATVSGEPRLEKTILVTVTARRRR